MAVYEDIAQLASELGKSPDYVIALAFICCVTIGFVLSVIWWQYVRLLERFIDWVMRKHHRNSNP